jgi:peptidoglycan LD-endopeptidase LytH
VSASGTISCTLRRLAALVGVAVGGFLLVVTPPARADDVGAAQARANAAAKAESAAEARAAELAVQVADLERRETATKAELDRLTATVRQVVIDRYVNAHETRLLAGTDLNVQVQVEALARFVAGDDQSSLDRYHALAQDLATERAATDAALAAQRKAVADLKAKQAAVEAELAHLVELQRQAEAAAAAAAAARPKAGAAAPAPPSGGGRPPTGVVASGAFVCPVQGPHSFSDDFGAPRSGGRTHQGNDIFAPRGTPVVTPVTGDVVDRGNSLGGLAVHITGADGTLYYGAHLSGYAATGHLAAGTVIGYVGNTGDAAGGPTHLHYEIHQPDGKVLDSFGLLLTAWQARQEQLQLGGTSPITPPAFTSDPGGIGGFPRYADGRPIYPTPEGQAKADAVAAAAGLVFEPPVPVAPPAPPS